MAKSKSGGTRSYIRGRVGADVYSIGKDAKGAKQQVVRSLAETVANPQTVAQMRGRMIMSTVMQAVSALSPIIDHSFDDVPVGQPSISEFISRNYALVKADVAAHPASGNAFGLNEYHVKGIQNGTWVISQGSVVKAAAIAYNNADGMKIQGTADTTKLEDYMALADISKGDYITMVALTASKKVVYFRVAVKESADETTVITAENVGSLFEIEGNVSVSADFSGNAILFAITETANYPTAINGFIVSKKTENGYKHSSCTLPDSEVIEKPAADAVLPSYPVGTDMYLNGGDL